MKKKCVIAYSGGLDTSAMIPWLLDRGFEVYAFIADVGQKENLIQLAARAVELGAKDCEIISCHQELSEIFESACLVNSRYEEKYYLGTALTRPIIAKAQIEYARSLGAETIVHGATGKGNDQIRFEFAYRTLAPELAVIAPWKEWSLNSRYELIEFLEERGFNYGFSKKKDYSIDKNAWHTSIEGGVLEDPHSTIELQKILSENGISDQSPKDQKIEFELNGKDVIINGESFNFYTGIVFLNSILMTPHWSVDLLIENRQTGIKSRGVYITVAPKIMYLVYDSLARSCLNKKAFDYYQSLGRSVSTMLYNGEYFSTQWNIFRSAMLELKKVMRGKVQVTLGEIPYVSKIESISSLFTLERSTFNQGEVDHSDASGFISLSWLSADGGGYR